MKKYILSGVRVLKRKKKLVKAGELRVGRVWSAA